MYSISMKGFALPSVLIASVVMLAILATAVSATVAIRTSLKDEHYTELAELAGEAGTTYAKACITKNGGKVLWSDDKPLRPNTDCSGNVVTTLSPYVLEQDNLRTYFVVKTPVADNIASEGFVEAIRTGTTVAWRVWGAETAAALPVDDGLPVGTSLEGYWTTAPPGFLLEDGSAVSRTTYASLFAVIGTTFGAGNGSTTFNLPDSRGRVVVNKSTDTEFNTLGKKSGEKTHTLTVAEMPSHNHGGTTGSTFPEVGLSANDGSSGSPRAKAGSNTGGRYSATYSEHDHTIASQGGGSAHNNIQPSIVALRVIKY